MAKTKREYFAEIRNIVVDNEELVAFIDHEVELLNKKASTPKKPTARQNENAILKGNIVDYLMQVAEPMCIKDMQAEIESLKGLTNQRITHLLTDLVKAGEVEKNYVKKVPYFSIAM